MKFLLTATGFTNEAIVRAAEDLLSKPRMEIKVGIINEAYTVEEGDKKWVINEMTKIAELFPKYVDLIDLLGLSADEIIKRASKCDMLYVVGGDTDFLMSSFNNGGLSERLEELLEGKLFVGSSAGAMIIGQRAPTEVYRYLYQEDDTFGISEYFELIPHTLIPHFNENNFDGINERSLTRLANQYNCRLDGINNSQALAVDGNKVEYINGEPFTVGS